MGAHNYTPHYMEHFKKKRFNRIKLLEIGVGGYEKPTYGGHSLRMWKRYFPNGQIFSIDIYDKSSLQEKRIKIYQGSQVDEGFLKNVLEDIECLCQNDVSEIKYRQQFHLSPFSRHV